MADDQDNEDLKDYYVIKFEKFIQLMEQTEHKYQILADMVHEQAIDNEPDSWDETPIKAIMRTFIYISELRDFLEDKINNAQEEEIKLANKYNIKDVLMKTEELAQMNVLLVSAEQLEADLQLEYKISIEPH